MTIHKLLAKRSLKSLLVGVGLLATALPSVAAEHQTVTSATPVLNCFGWKYSTIKDNLDKIANANFGAVQVSSVQPLAKSTSGLYFHAFYKSAIPDWYRIYMPTDLAMISGSDQNPLGSRADFDALVTAAHNKGIAIIVGVEANQVAANGYNNTSITSSMVRSPYVESDWSLNTQHSVTKNGRTFNFNNPFADPTRDYFTMRSINEGVLDLKTEDADVQTKVSTFIDQLYNAGVDGICWYHAKYIGLKYGQGYENTGYDMGPNTAYMPSNYSSLSSTQKEEAREFESGGDFWPTVYNKMKGNNMFSYVRINIDPNFKGEQIISNSNKIPQMSNNPNYWSSERNITDEDNFHRPFREYTKYGRVADAWLAKSSAWQAGLTWANGYWTGLQGNMMFSSNWNTNMITGFYAAEKSDMVYYAEDEDNFFNNPEIVFEPMSTTNGNSENRTTNSTFTNTYSDADNRVPEEEDIDRTYADMASHNDVVPVYFSRPFNSNGVDYKLGNDFSELKDKHYLYYEDTENWIANGKTVNVYAYGDNSKIKSASWPGAPMGTFVKVGTNNGHNVYQWITEKDPTGSTLIFNLGDGQPQTANLPFVEGAYYTKSGQLTSLTDEQKKGYPMPDGSQRDSITVFLRVTNDKAFPVKENTYDGNVVKYLGKSIDRPYLFYTHDGWSNFQDKEGNNIVWPGREMSTTTDANGRKWYYIHIPNNATNIIFNNGCPDGTDVEKYKRQTGNIVGIVPDENNNLYYEWSGEQTKKEKGEFPDGVTEVKTHYGVPELATSPSYLRFTSKAITAANELHNRLNGEEEQRLPKYDGDGTGANIGISVRTDGAVMVMRNPLKHRGSHSMANVNGTMKEGKYTDLVSGNEFNVSSSNVTGVFGNSGIAVLIGNNIETKPYTITPSYTGDGTITFTITNKSGKPITYEYSNNTNFRNGYTYQDIADAYNLSPYVFRYSRYRNYYVNQYLSEYGTKASGLLDGPSEKEKTTSQTVNYYNENEDKTRANLDYGIYNKPSTKIYVRVHADGKTYDEAYTIKNDGSYEGKTLALHNLYIHLPDSMANEVVKPENFTIYAWTENGSKQIPLFKGDYRLASDDPNTFETPLKGIYKTDCEQSEPQQDRYGYTYYPISSNDVSYFGIIGASTDGVAQSSYYGGSSGYCFTSKAAMQNALNTKYDVEKVASYNDVYNVGAMKIHRITIGIPGMDLPDVKFRLTYHNPRGFDQELDDVELHGTEDQFYDVQYNANSDQLNIAPMMSLVGDAIYDNAQWDKYKYDKNKNYYFNTPSSTEYDDGKTRDNSIFWHVLTTGEKASDFPYPTVMTYDPQTSRTMSKDGQTASVYTYTGQFIHGKYFRFAERFDLMKGFYKDEKSKHNDATKYKVYVKPVTSKYWNNNFTNSRWSQYNMERGLYCPDDGNGNVTVISDNSSEDGSNAFSSTNCKDLQWELPSGYYTVKFYRVTKPMQLTITDDDNKEITQVIDSTEYYFEISRPTYKYFNGSEGKVLSKDMKIATNSDGSAAEYSDAVGGGYYQNDLAHLGNYVGNRGETITIDDHNSSEAKTYSLEFKNTSNSNATDDYRSLYPETGPYRIIYRPTHGTSPNTSGLAANVDHTNNKAVSADYHFLLGMNFYRNSNDLVWVDGKDNYSGNLTAKTAKPGYYKGYSDGLPRIKPSGVTAYYVSGYNWFKGSDVPKAVFLTELKGDVLPANTGLILYFSEDAIAKDPVHFKKLSNTTTYKDATLSWARLYLEANDENGDADFNKETVTHMAGTNFLKPYIACVEDYGNEEWKTPFNKRSSLADYSKFWMTIGRPTGWKEEAALGFFGVQDPTGNDYELRNSVACFPMTKQEEKDPGDVTFSAKPRKVSNGQEVVITAPIDCIFGDISGLTDDIITGITDTEVDPKISDDNAYYNLSGQRVSNPQRGIYIHRGKKVIIK